MRILARHTLEFMKYLNYHFFLHFGLHFFFICSFMSLIISEKFFIFLSFRTKSFKFLEQPREILNFLASVENDEKTIKNDEKMIIK